MPTTAQDSPSIAQLSGTSYAQPTHQPMHSVATHAAEGDSTDEELMDEVMNKLMIRRATMCQGVRCGDDVHSKL